MDFFHQPPMPKAWMETDFQIFNDKFIRKPSSVVEFPAFCRLPVDLRLRIWKEFLASSRWINMKIYQDHVQAKAQRFYSSKNMLEKTVSNYPYQVELQGASPEGGRRGHALLWVNREANHVFLAHYRVRLPIISAQGMQQREFLYNPEHDTLNLQLGSGICATALIALIHDAIAHDPKGIGIANLALGYAEAAALARQLPSSYGKTSQTSIIQFLTRSLQNIYLVNPLTVEARNMLGKMSWPHGDIHQNRSFPLSSNLLQTGTQVFSLLERDPRPIENDLFHIAVGIDPRRCLYQWTKFVVHYLGSEYQQRTLGINVRYLLSISPAHNRSSDYPIVQGRNGFVDFIRVLDYRWANWMHKLKLPLWGKRLTEEEAKGQRNNDVGETSKEALLEPVAGFWLFPIDAFGNIDEFHKSIEEKDVLYAEDIEWKPKLVKDLSLYPPALGVFHL